MIVISDLLRDRAAGRLKNEDWVFNDDDALREAQIVGVRLDAINSLAGILFDLRTSLHLDESNTGVLVVGGVTGLQWAARSGQSGKIAWTVVGSEIRSGGTGVEIGLRLHPDGELRVSGASAVFHAVDVPDLKTIPDYLADSEEEIRQMTPQWESPVRVNRTTRLAGVSP